MKYCGVDAASLIDMGCLAMNSSDPATLAALTRIADALERLTGTTRPPPDLAIGDAYVWQGEEAKLEPVEHVNRVPITLLKGVDRVRDILLENTSRFAQGLPANNVLLWGARGMGKSSLVKAVHGEVCRQAPGTLVIIEIHREEIETLPALMRGLRDAKRQVLIFCDDLSFDKDDTSYKALKAVLEGGLEGRPRNVLFYATSNRRHLMPREMVENERSTAINPSEAVEEKVSLSDRFGLWLGLHNCTQDDYLAMVTGYARHFALNPDDPALTGEALEWATTRGARSGRVAWQFIQDRAGKLGKKLGA